MANRTSNKSSKLRGISTKATKKSASRPTKSRVVKTDDEVTEGSPGEEAVLVDRRRNDRRDEVAGQAAAPTSAAPQLERRKKVNRRRQIDPTTCERDYTDQGVEFMNALDDYKRKSGRMFPTCSEVLEVLRGLGYAKLSTADFAAMTVDSASTTSAKPMPNDWQGTEAPIENTNEGAAIACEPHLTF